MKPTFNFKPTIMYGKRIIESGKDLKNFIRTSMWSEDNFEHDFFENYDEWKNNNDLFLTDEAQDNQDYFDELTDKEQEIETKIIDKIAKDFDESTPEEKKDIVKNIDSYCHKNCQHYNEEINITYDLDEFKKFARANGWSEEKIEDFLEWNDSYIYDYEELIDLDDLAWDFSPESEERKLIEAFLHEAHRA